MKIDLSPLTIGSIVVYDANGEALWEEVGPWRIEKGETLTLTIKPEIEVSS